MKYTMELDLLHLLVPNGRSLSVRSTMVFHIYDIVTVYLGKNSDSGTSNLVPTLFCVFELRKVEFVS